MSPRRYDMTRKRALAAATRRRIVEATLKLHSEKGIFGTSWTDIAQEANVAVGTVYRYFPSIEELVPACGELLMQRTKPPSPDDISAILGDATDPVDRLRRVADAIFGFYARGGKSLESDIRERELPAVREWEDYLRHMVREFVLEALKDAPGQTEAKERLCFLFDVPTFNAMRIRGLSPELAAETATKLAARWLEIGTDAPKQRQVRKTGRAKRQ